MNAKGTLVSFVKIGMVGLVFTECPEWRSER